MQDDQNTRFILMAAAGLLVCALLFIVVWGRLFSPNSDTTDLTVSGEQIQSNQQQIVPIQGEGSVEVATSSVRTQQLQDIMNSWQEDTVVATSAATSEVVPIVEEEPAPPPAPPTNQQRFPPADLSGLGFESQSQVSVGSGGPLPTGLPSAVDAGSFQAAELPVLPDSSADDCGSLTIPASAFGIAFFSTGLSRNPEVVCMGEAVADRCDTHSLTIISDDGLDGQAYVAEDSNGRCSVGFHDTGSDLILLCDLQTILNETYSESLSWTMWQSRFREDPGGRMAGLITSNFGLLTNPAVADSFGCVEYALP